MVNGCGLLVTGIYCYVMVNGRALFITGYCSYQVGYCSWDPFTLHTGWVTISRIYYYFGNSDVQCSVRGEWYIGLRG